MSFFKIFSPSKSRKRKPQRKTPPKAKAQARLQPSNKPKPSEPAPLPPEPSRWDRLSSERKLDLTGIILAVLGILILLTLFASSRSVLTADLIRFLAQIFGWGIYILPVALFFFGVWLILRRNERLPAFSLERATGIVFLFFWLLAFMHIIYVPLNLASDAADHGVGGGYIGSFFEVVLWNGLGLWGAVIILMAWFLIALTMTLDITMQDLFRWIGTGFIATQIFGDQTISASRANSSGRVSQWLYSAERDSCRAIDFISAACFSNRHHNGQRAGHSMGFAADR